MRTLARSPVRAARMAAIVDGIVRTESEEIA
jgi:hypothetical protein